MNAGLITEAVQAMILAAEYIRANTPPGNPGKVDAIAKLNASKMHLGWEMEKVNIEIQVDK